MQPGCEEQACGSYAGVGMQRTHGQLPAPHVQHTTTITHGRNSLARVTDRCAQPLGGGVPGCRGRVMMLLQFCESKCKD